jgi:hypothetical protein
MPAMGAIVRLRDREGFVSRASFGDLKRVGDMVVSIGAWIEVTLNDGKGPANVIQLRQDQWGDLEVLPT